MGPFNYHPEEARAWLSEKFGEVKHEAAPTTSPEKPAAAPTTSGVQTPAAPAATAPAPESAKSGS
jgi:hypothetical protein